jgi:hypothetical protein
VRDKLGMAAFVVLLIAVWGGGFLWFRGDLSPGSDKGSAKSSAKASKTTADADPSPSTSPDSSPTAVPAVAGKYTGNVSVRDERKAVNLNPTAVRPRPIALPPIATFKMATFNLLGSSHSKKGGSSAGFAPGTSRMNGALQILAQHQVSVVGFQEFQPDQRNAFRSRAKGWEMYPGLSMGRRAGENSVAWRSDTWEMVRPGLIPIPYFNGNIRPMPYVLLRNKQTGIRAYFSTFHNPANIGGNMSRFRREATRREINLFNQLETQGIPQFVTGDMNDNNEYFCPVTAGTQLIAAAGGSNNGGCVVPRPTPIDWIFGSPGVVFSNYVYDQSPLVHHTTDHPVPSTTVTIDALKFKNAYDPNAPITPGPPPTP